MPTTRPRRVPRTAAPDPNSRAATTPPASTPSARDSLDRRDLVLAISPFGRPDARVTAAAVRAGALGVLDLGRDRHEAIGADEMAQRRSASEARFAGSWVGSPARDARRVRETRGGYVRCFFFSAAGNSTLLRISR